MSITHLHSHCTPQHPLSHPHAFLASTFPPTCCCMHLCTFTLVCVHPANLRQLCPTSRTRHVPTSQTMVEAAQPPPICPNELSPHSAHQILILAVKHCCMLWHPLHPHKIYSGSMSHMVLYLLTRPDASGLRPRSLQSVHSIVPSCPCVSLFGFD